MRPMEIIFEVTEAAEGGYDARARVTASMRRANRGMP